MREGHVHFFLDITNRNSVRIPESAFLRNGICFFSRQKGVSVKVYQRFCIVLLFLSLLIPLNVAYYYYDHYSEIKLQVRKHFAVEDEDSLLIQFKKNPRIIYSPVLSVQNHLHFLLEVSFLCHWEAFFTNPKDLVLRC